MSNQLMGTANLLSQVTAYQALEEEYSSETASVLVARNLTRNGVQATPKEVVAWNKINEASIHGQLNIQQEHERAMQMVAPVAQKFFGLASGVINMSTVEEPSGQEGGQQDADYDVDDDAGYVLDEEEAETVNDLYGYDDPEDNAEAALDDLLKIWESTDL